MKTPWPRLWLTLLLLTTLTITLTSATLTRPPALRELSFNPTTVTTAPGAVAINFNETLTPTANLTITPAAAHTFTVTCRQIVINFTTPLQAASTYQLTATATSASTGRSSTVTTQFTTAPLELITSHTTPTRTVITRHTVGSNTTTELFSAAHITEFTVAGKWLAALQPVDTFEQRLTVLNLDTNTPTALPLPAATTPREPRIAPDGTVLGVRFNNGSADNLWLYPLHNLQATAARPVVDAHGNELAVAAWRFAPDSSAVLLQTPAGQLYRATFGAPATPVVGGWEQAGGSAPRPSPLPHPQLTLRDGSVLRLRNNNLLELATNSGSRELFRPAVADTSLGGICVSPNQQYALVQLRPAGAVAQFEVLQLPEGTAVQRVYGETALWCAD